MRRRLSLRQILIIGIVVLIAAVTIAIGAFSTIALRNNLIARLDTQLLSATDRSFDHFGPGSENSPPPSGGEGSPPTDSEVLGIPGQREGTIAGIVTDGSLSTAQIITGEGTLRSLSTTELDALSQVPADGNPQTVQVGELGSYRVILRSSASGPGDGLVMALPLAETNETVWQLTLLIGGAGLIGIGLAVVAGTFVVRLAMRPLDRIAATATQVSGLPLDQGAVALPMRVESRDADPATEVGQVGEALNTLLDHVAGALTVRQESEEKLRRFVADASHELRTPLASIRGYAELTRRSPDPLPEPVAYTIGRIESESVRMTALVEDLLLLARLDEGEQVRRDPVDLTQLLADTVSDARAAGPDHRWKLIVPPEPVIVPGDAMRLHQIIVNLLSNARVHTPAGTEVTASVRAERDAAIVEVRDTGPGIDAGVSETLFERFVRADSTRSRKTGSTGLGLAIARAIVASHGGELTVTSQPGDTVFTMRLPIAS